MFRFSAWLGNDEFDDKNDPDYIEYFKLFVEFLNLSRYFPSREYIPQQDSQGNLSAWISKSWANEPNVPQHIAFLHQKWTDLRACMTKLGNCAFVQRKLNKQAVRIGDLYCSITHRLLQRDVVMPTASNSNEYSMPSNTYFSAVKSSDKTPISGGVSDHDAQNSELNVHTNQRVVYYLGREQTRNKYISMLEQEMFQPDPSRLHVIPPYSRLYNCRNLDFNV